MKKRKLSDPSLISDGYARGHIWGRKQPSNSRIIIGVPMTGLLRCEWVVARYGQVIPCNWSMVESLQFYDQYSPVNYLVADARNLVVSQAVNMNFEWLFFIDHDTILPPRTVLMMNEYMLSGKYPVVSGLYFTKSVPSEPLVYRGIGTSYYANWHFGDIIPVDGVPMGCTLIHVSILKAMWDEAEEYQIGNNVVRRVFRSPAETWFDPEQLSWMNEAGTEDLHWCHKVINEDYFIKATKYSGKWEKFAKKKYPFMIDTRMYCKHIEFDGIQYPSMGEDLKFLKKA